MIDTRAKLTLLKVANETSNLTDLAADYLRDPFNFDLEESEYLYIGLYKPFGAVFVEMDTPSESETTASFEYYDGSSWQSLDVQDETRKFTRSGFIFWEKNKLVKTMTSGLDNYWIRVKVDSAPLIVVIRGINIVFTDTQRMKQEFFEIDNANLLPNGESSHIATLVACRNQIIDRLRRNGYQKVSSETGREEMINAWDLLDVFEVREAATALALSKVFLNLSSSQDDHWWSKYQTFNDRYNEMIRVAHLSVDKSDDSDDNQLQARVQNFRWNR